MSGLAAQRQDGLKHAIAAALRRTAGGIALDEKQLRLVAVAAGAIHELTRQTAGVENALAIVDGFLGLGRCLACFGGHHHFLHDLLGVLGVLFQVLAQQFVDDGSDDALDFGIVEANLGLCLELRFRHLDTNHGG